MEWLSRGSRVADHVAVYCRGKSDSKSGCSRRAGPHERAGAASRDTDSTSMFSRFVRLKLGLKKGSA